MANGEWKFTDPSTLTYQDKPIPPALSANNIHLVTPLGSFEPQADGKWGFIQRQIPLPDTRKQWVMMTLNSCTEEMKLRGYYRTDGLAVQTSSWRDTQLGGTPANWVYAYKVKDGKEAGYWIAPEKIKDIDWKQL